MKKSLWYMSLISLAFSSCSSSAFVVKETQMIPEDFAGMVHAGNRRTDEEYTLLNDMGVSWVLATFYWGSIEPQQGAWNFSNYDSFVERAKQDGKKIIAVLAYDTPWMYADEDKKKPNPHIRSKDIPQYLNFVEATILRYQDTVDAWSVWNEPNVARFWKGSKQEFIELTKATIQKIREIAPDSTILAGALSGLPTIPFVSESYVGYIKALFESGAMEQASGFAFHPYSTNPQGTAALYDKMVKLVTPYGFQDKIWITEVGYPTHGFYPSKVSEEKQPAYVIQTLSTLAAKGARVICWYEMFDKYNREDKRTADSEHYFGLLYPNYEPKPGAAAYGLVSRYIAGMTYQPQSLSRDGVPSSLVAYYFEGENNLATLILWKTSGKQTLQLSLPGTGHVLHDAVTGDKRPLEPQTTLLIGTMPSLITWTRNGESPSISN
jgi:GH35 family endo-1,4-beta-xylanase